MRIFCPAMVASVSFSRCDPRRSVPPAVEAIRSLLVKTCPAGLPRARPFLVSQLVLPTPAVGRVARRASLHPLQGFGVDPSSVTPAQGPAGLRRGPQQAGGTSTLVKKSGREPAATQPIHYAVSSPAM